MIPNEPGTPSVDTDVAGVPDPISAETPTSPDVSADTLPAPGTAFRGRTVRASGVLPISGAPFVLYRHTARQELASLASATAASAAEGSTSDEELAAWMTAALIATNLEVSDAGGWRGRTVDDVLDLDADDFSALNQATAASRTAPRPPSPTS